MSVALSPMIFKNEPKNPFRSPDPKKSEAMKVMASQSVPGAPLSPYDGIHHVPLLAKKTLVEGVDGKICPVRTLTFGLPNPTDRLNETFNLGVGPILKIHLPADPNDLDTMVHKSYSPTDVTSEGSFDLTVKIYPGGRNSDFLDGLKIGDTAPVSGPWPPIPRQKKRRPGKFVNLVAYGVGLTEIFFVAKAELEKPDATKVHLLYANRHKEDSFFTQELQQLQNQYGAHRFQVTYIYSRDDNVPDALYGRVNPQVLQQVFGLDQKDSMEESVLKELRFLFVGSKEMMAQTWDYLETLGFVGDQYRLLL